MGRFGEDACFLGTDRALNGYVDDGKPMWRLLHKKPTKKQFWKAPHLDATRAAAFEFGAASVIAGKLWDGMPAGMRRLADSGGFNRLVGHIRVATFEGREAERGGTAGYFGELWDVEGLRNLDLSLDSGGPHRVAGGEGLVASLGSEHDLGRDRGHDASCPYKGGFKLVGMDALCYELDAVAGVELGKQCVVASRFFDDGICRDREDMNLGSCDGWGEAARERLGARFGTGHDLSVPSRPQRRVRVWVNASEVVETEFVDNNKSVERAGWSFRRRGGYVTDWLVLEDGVASAYAIQGGALFTPEMLARRGGTGAFVVFTAVEVSEKRGRHWVRLPHCCKMRVSDVVFVEQLQELAVSSEQVAVVELAVDRAVLVAVREQNCLRRSKDSQVRWLSGLVDEVVGSAADCVDFIDLKEFLRGEWLGASGESRPSGKDRGRKVLRPYDGGELVRAGP